MIRVFDLVYTVGAFRLEVSFQIGVGEYFVVMGPTGSGKTAAVECLAGLRRPQSGRIEISGRDVTGSEPRHRSIGYVPQDYALFTQRTVRRNIAFGPEVRGWPSERIRQAILDSARLVGIEHLLERRIQGLSGGERQRVALARALAVQPDVLVLDEPVSALDEVAREQVCSEIRRVQRKLNLTTIHISHNLEEAFSVADRAAVMRNGRIEQTGRMDDLLRRPGSEFVARFMRCENVFHADVRAQDRNGTMTVAQADGIDFLVPSAYQGRVDFMIRPEDLHVARPGHAPEGNRGMVAVAQVVRAVDRGAYVRVELTGTRRLMAHVQPASAREMGLNPGLEVQVSVRPESIHVFGSSR